MFLSQTAAKATGLEVPLFPGFLVRAKGCSAVDEGIVSSFPSLVHVPEPNCRQGYGVGSSGTVIVPRGAGSLVRLVKVIESKLVHKPEHGGGISGYVSTLSAGFVVPKLVGGDELDPSSPCVDRYGLMFLCDPVYEDLALSLQLFHHFEEMVVVGVILLHWEGWLFGVSEDTPWANIAPFRL